MRLRLVLAAIIIAIIVIVAAFGLLVLGSAGGKTTSGKTMTSVSLLTSTSGSISSFQSSTTFGPGSQVEWMSYHGDNSRDAFVSLSVSNASRGWTSPALDGLVYAEPLSYKGMVFVATENDSVYALNEETGAIMWKAHLGTPVPGSSLPCGGIDPSGITGTPVIDPASGTLYAVTFEMPFHHSLVGLDTVNGSVRFSIPADPTNADPTVQQQRAALTLANGHIYILYGGLLGDCGAYHGWVAAANVDGSGSLVSYQVPTGREGGIWGTSGAITDASGNLFVATGNGASSTTFDYGDSVIKLSPDLTQLSYFAPSNWLQLNEGDTDLGSSGPTLLGQGAIFQIGKEGVGYILDPANLGGIGGQVYSSRVCSSVFGGNAYAGGVIFVPCSDGLRALRFSGNSFSQMWAGPDFDAGPPVVTGNVVWTLDVGSGVLYGFDAISGTQLFSFSTGSVTHFTTPSVGTGMVLVAAGDTVYSFRLS